MFMIAYLIKRCQIISTAYFNAPYKICIPLFSATHRFMGKEWSGCVFTQFLTHKFTHLSTINFKPFEPQVAQIGGFDLVYKFAIMQTYSQKGHEIANSKLELNTTSGLFTQLI